MQLQTTPQTMKIELRRIGDETTQTINARELHAFLEIGKDFSTWIKDRIEQFGFIEGQDFATYLLPNIGEKGQGRPTKEYLLSLNMAKELSMVERNEKGKQARQYFIECERRAKGRTQPAELSRMDILKLAMDSEQARIEAEKQLALAAPKVHFVDKYVQASTGSKGFRQVCKLLNVKEPVFRQFLKDKGVMYYLGREWVPHAQHIDAGRFETKAGVAEHGDSSHAYNQAMFTAKGVSWIAGEWAKHQVAQATATEGAA